MGDKLTHSQLTDIFITNNVPRDGHLYKYALRLQGIETLDANNQRDRAHMGFGAKSALINYTNKLIAAGLATATYDAEGNLLLVHFIFKG